jgi:uracil-DNA glycosylase
MKSKSLEEILKKINKCNICTNLPHGPKPILQVHINAKILIIGQAPGLKAHQSGIPWDDASGERLREWMKLSKEIFYDDNLIAILPMGFCYPGKGEKGDLPPRPECYPEWHQMITSVLPHLELIVLIGSYSQNIYLKKVKKKTLTETVRTFADYAPLYFPLPHPSPLNNIWLSKNAWFNEEVLPALKLTVLKILNK